jgi:tyrosyl-tRNA synthetase
MAAKKRLARSITADFHGEEAAQAADENWAKMFQQKETAEDLEEVEIEFWTVAQLNTGSRPILIDPEDGSILAHPSECLVHLPKLLVAMGLAASNAEANRKIAEKAVKLDGEPAAAALISVPVLPARIVVRLGKRAKVAVIA